MVHHSSSPESCFAQTAVPIHSPRAAGGGATSTSPEPPSSAEELPAPIRTSSTAVHRWRRWLIGVVGVLLLLLVVAQLTLPRIAADSIRHRLSAHGHVLSVSVSAFPAIKLLWGQADSVSVRMSSYGPAHTTTTSASSSTHSVRGHATPSSHPDPHSSMRRLADLLANTANTDSLTASVGQFDSGHVHLEQVVVDKHSGQLTASALLTADALHHALPPHFALHPITSPAGELLFHGRAKVLGSRLAVKGRLIAHHGRLVIEPDLGGFFPSFLSLNVFDDSRIVIESVHSQATRGGWELTASARIRDS